MIAPVRDIAANRPRRGNLVELAEDVERFASDVRELFREAYKSFRERPTRPTGVITYQTNRPRLKFGEFPVVDTRTDEVSLYLPQAKVADAGRFCGFVKSITSRTVFVRPTDGTLINGREYLDGCLEAGLYEFLWDGSAWHTREPSGRVRPHDLRYNPLALWQLNDEAGNMEDTSGNDYHLSVEAGTEKYSYLTPWLGGFRFDGSTRLFVSSFTSALARTGDVSALMLIIVTSLPSAGSSVPFITHQDGGELQAENALYNLGIDSDGDAVYFHEQGAGTNEQHDITSYITLGQLSHVGFTRSSNVVQHYVNGRTWGAASAALNTPDGGGDGRLRIGGFQGVAAGSNLFATVASVALYSRALTAAEVRERRNHCFSSSYGYIDAY